MTSTETQPHPTYGPPLTADDFPWTHYGVPITWIGEDADRFIALGHVPPLRMVAAANALERVDGADGLDYIFPYGAKQALEAVKHVWAVRRPDCTYDGAWPRCPQSPDCRPPDTDFRWYIDWADGITAETPGAFPITELA